MLLLNLDWLEFTYKIPYSDQTDLLAEFFDEFPEFESVQDDLVMWDHGLQWYNCVLQYRDEFLIMYHSSRYELGIHVVIQSHSLNTIANLFGLDDILDFYDCSKFFALLRSRHCKPTRIDICYDDYEKILTPDDFDYFRATKRITCPCANVGFIESKRGEGSTFSIGKRGKGRYLRIYDKNYESKGRINAIRYEFELRTNWALLIFDKVINGEKFTFRSLLENFVYISNDINYDPSNDDKSSEALCMRRKRAGILDKWDRLLQLCAKDNLIDEEISLKLPTNKQEISYRKIHEWLSRSCLRRMYQSYLALGEDKFLDFVLSGRSKQSESDFLLIQKYREENEEFSDLIEDLLFDVKN